MNLSEVLANLHKAVIFESNTGDSESSDQRERNYRAYYMEPLDSDVESASEGDDLDSKTTVNHNTFVTSDVFDVVEDTKAAISETFAHHRNVIRFEGKGPNDEQAVEYANEYVRECFWEKNNGFKFINDSVHDGSLAKDAIAKVYWLEDEDAEEIPVEGMSPDQVIALLSQDNVEPAEDFETAQQNVFTPEGEEVEVYTGHLTVTKDTSYQKLELVPRENFFADHTQADKFILAQDRVEKTLDELKEMGLSDEQADQLNPSAMTDLRDVEDQARHQNDSTYQFYQNALVTDDQDAVWLYNAHFITDLDGNGPRPWFIQYSGNYVFADGEVWDRGDDMTTEEAIKQGFIQPMSRIPYRTWSPYPLSHRWSGMALADPVYVIQEMRSKMQRSIVDYMARTNNPRLQGSADNIENFDEFIENPIGGFANLEDPAEPVTAIDQPQMSPLVFQTLEMVTQERDERVPQTRLSSGRNQDVVSNQNAETMIDKLAARGEKRMAMLARNYAEFLKDILMDLYIVGVENDEKPVMIQVAGGYQEVIPKSLPKHLSMSISVALTPQEATQEARRLLSLHSTFLADETLSTLYEPDKRYALMSEVCELMDRQDFQKFLTNPQDEEFQKRQTAQQQAAQQAQQQQAMAQQQMQKELLAIQGQFAIQLEAIKAEQRQRDNQVEASIKRIELLLKEREVEVKEATASVDQTDKLIDMSQKAS